jgi:hypothetical protein
MPYVSGHAGHEIIVTMTTDSSNKLNFAGIDIKPFTYDASFNGGTGTGLVSSVTTADFPGYHYDTYTVKLNYSYDAIPLVTTTVGALIVIAEGLIDAAITAGIGGGGPSVAPTNVDAVSGLI